MNKSSLLGLAAVSGVLYFGIFGGARNPGIFFEPHAIVLVVGGTFAAGLLAFPLNSLTRIVDFFLWGMIFKKKKEYLKVSQEISGARQSYLINQNYFTAEDSHPFLREAVLFLLNKNIDNAAFFEILRKRSAFFHKKYQEDAEVISSLARYPIGLGVLGLARSFIESFQSFGSANSPGIGVAVAVALVPLCLGFAFSNLILMPIADSARQASDQDVLLRNLIIDGMILIRSGATDDHFQAHLRGYLNLVDRNELKIQTPKETQNISGLSLKRKKKTSDTEEYAEAPVSERPENILPIAVNVEPQTDTPAPVPAPVANPVANAATADFKKVDLSQDTIAFGKSPQPPPTNVVSDSVVRKPEEGHVEKSIRISLEDDRSIDLGKFRFNDLRKELKKKAK